MTAGKTAMTTQEIAARFNELAQQEKWFEIQEVFFADDVKSADPPDSPILVMRKVRNRFVKKVRTL